LVKRKPLHGKHHQARKEDEMKIAVLSDIHGNLGALDAVLAHLAAQNVDQVVNLGDICSGGLFPRETADRLMPLRMPTVRGNHERQIGDRALSRMGLSDRHAATSLRPDQRAWLTSLPETLRLPGDILLVHGSPRGDLEYLLETVTVDGVRMASVAEVEERVASVEAAVVLCGHTHIPRTMTLERGLLIVNPGSVGLPAYDDDHPYPHVIETGSPHARYAIIANDGSGWTVAFHAVGYDWEQAAAVAIANGRPDWSRALRTGRV
jgi:putative phosphoesterase